MLKVSYIAPSTPTVKPKKQSQKEKIHQEAMETLELAKFEDRKKAKEMFRVEREYNLSLKQKLAELKKNLKPKTLIL